MSSFVRPLANVAFSSLFAAVLAASAMPAVAAKRQPPAPQPVVERSASGTIIQPTTTIIPDGYGHSRVIVIPRRRSYLDTGTEVSIGDRSFRDYVLPPGGDGHDASAANSKFAHVSEGELRVRKRHYKY